MILMGFFQFRIFCEKWYEVFILSGNICFCCETAIIVRSLKHLAFCHSLSVGVSSSASQVISSTCATCCR